MMGIAIAEWGLRCRLKYRVRPDTVKICEVKLFQSTYISIGHYLSGESSWAENAR